MTTSFSFAPSFSCRAVSAVVAPAARISSARWDGDELGRQGAGIGGGMRGARPRGGRRAGAGLDADGQHRRDGDECAGRNGASMGGASHTDSFCGGRCVARRPRGTGRRSGRPGRARQNSWSVWGETYGRCWTYERCWTYGWCRWSRRYLRPRDVVLWGSVRRLPGRVPPQVACCQGPFNDWPETVRCAKSLSGSRTAHDRPCDPPPRRRHEPCPPGRSLQLCQDTGRHRPPAPVPPRSRGPTPDSPAVSAPWAAIRAAGQPAARPARGSRGPPAPCGVGHPPPRVVPALHQAVPPGAVQLREPALPAISSSGGPSSTIRPSSITSTRSAMSTVDSRCAITTAVRPAQHRVHRALHRPFTRDVQGGGGLVQDEHRGVGQQRAGEGRPVGAGPRRCARRACVRPCRTRRAGR